MISNINIYGAGTSRNKANVLIMPQSVYHAELMVSEYITLEFNLSTYVEFNLGDYVRYEGKRYLLTDIITPSRGNTGGYTYRLQFNAEWMEWEHRLMMFDRGYALEAAWNMTQKPAYFLDIVQSNVQREGLATFDTPIIDSTLTELKYISFDGDGIVSALNKIAAAWECEWWLTSYNDKYTIHLGYNNGISTPVILTDGIEIASVTRQDSQNKNRVSRLYAFGSDRNISKYYRKHLVFTAQDSENLNYINSHLPNGYTAAICDSSRKLLADYFSDSFKQYKPVDVFGSNRQEKDSTFDTFTGSSYLSAKLSRNMNIKIGDNESGEYKITLNVSIVQKVLKQSQQGKKVRAAQGEDGFYKVYIKDETTGAVMHTWEIPAIIFVDFSNKYVGENLQVTLPLIAGHQYTLYYECKFIPYYVELVGQQEGQGGFVNWQASLDSDFTLQSLNASVGVSFKANGNLYSGVFNPLYHNQDSKLYNMIAYVGERLNDGTQYTIENLYKYNVPAEYLTGNVSSVIAGVANPVLLLPEEPCYKGADGKIYRQSELITTEGYEQIYNGQGYIDNSKGLEDWEIVEGKTIFSDVYPRLLATITDIKTEQYADGDKTFDAYRIKADELVDFSDKWKIDGKDLQVTIQTGDLAGFTFDVNNVKVYNDTTREYETYFEIIRNDEEYGVPIPNPTLKPAIGNKFILSGFNVEYVDVSYTPRAEVELLEEALAWLDEQAKDTSVYSCQMNMVNALQRGHTNYKIGQPVRFVSTIYGERDSRIRSIEKRLDGRSLTYTLGKSAAYSRFNSLEQTIEGLSYAAKGLSATMLGGINESVLQQRLDEVKREISDTYFNKVENDTAKGEYRFEKSIEFGDGSFRQGEQGAKIWFDGDGWRIQCDYLNVTKKMYAKEVQVDEVSHVGGQLLLTSASCVADAVEQVVDSNNITTGYRIYFRQQDGEGRKVYNEWQVGDLAYCQSMTINKGITEDFTNRYYWMLVTNVGEEDGRHYIELSVSIADKGGKLAVTSDYTTIPQAGDNVVQLGHRKRASETEADAAKRQGAIFVSGGAAGQYISIYQGISTFNLPAPKILLSPENVSINADEIRLASKGLLELGANQLVCKNVDGDKTAWLDNKGNFSIAGIINKMHISIDDNNVDDYFYRSSLYEYSEDSLMFRRQSSGSSSDFIINETVGLILAPDMMKMEGIIDINLTGGVYDMFFPMALPVAYEERGLIYARPWYDVVRSKANDHLITSAELQSIAGREVVISNNGGDIYIRLPWLKKVGDGSYEWYNSSSHYTDLRLGNRQSVTIRMVGATTIVNNVQCYGIFPIIVDSGNGTFLDGLPEWDIVEETED